MSGQKKIPQRRCVGCGEMKSKKELMRIVRTPEGEILSDATGRKNGRGAYLCRQPECLAKAARSHALEHALGAAVSPEVYDALAKEMVPVDQG